MRTVGMKIAVLTMIVVLPAAAIYASRRDRARTNSPHARVTNSLLSTLPHGGSSLADKAIAAWEKKLRANDKDALAWTGLGDAIMQKARETADIAFYNLAEKAYKEALAHDARSAGATLGLAWVSGGRHQFDESIAWANKAIALNPGNQAAYGLIGDAQVEMGNYDGAYESYQKMLDIRPDLASYSRGAHLLYLTGDTRKALYLMNRAVTTGGPYAENTAWCRAQMGIMLFGMGELKAAEQVLEDAVRRSPNDYHVQSALGRVKAAKKDYPAAIVAYRKAVEVAPQVETLVALGDLYELTDRKKDAETAFAQVEAIHSLQKANGAIGDRQIAQFYADHDLKLPDALRMAQDEYGRFKNVYAADTLAWCLYKNGKYTEAREMIHAARSHKTPDAQLLYHEGMILAKLGDRTTAQKRLYQALSLNPGFSPTGARIASETLRQMGQRASL